MDWSSCCAALFVGLLAFLLLILGWQKQLDQESAEYEALSSAAAVAGIRTALSSRRPKRILPF
ncbi:MAG: hypothetical protein ACLSCX_08415 [Oscillospiraceae bacterium]